MALAELLQLLTLPFWIHYFQNGRTWDLGSVTCASVGLGFVTNLYAKQGFLCLIALERYIGVVHIMRYRSWNTLLRAAQISVGAWVLVSLLCTLGYIILRNDTIHKNSTLCYEGYPTGNNYSIFKLSTVWLSFIAPSLLMVFFYSSILLKLRKVESIPPEEKKRLFVLTIFTVVTFVLIMGPYHVLSFYKHLMEIIMANDQGELCRLEASILLYIQITLGLTTLGNIINPLVYVLLSKGATVELTNTFKCLPDCYCIGGRGEGLS
ncbi:G-protein coupled receptor 4-like [Pleurodeles waltl]|uniref:G-protein coupled receptor 4-like n=1 Tax=Pleurodeles waltl TaxID=8319 RepID=UPI003709ADB3